MARRTFVWLMLAVSLAWPLATIAAPRHSLEEGASALELQVQPGLFSSFFGSYSSAGLAAKFHFTDRSAVRLGLMVGISSSDGEGTRSVDRFFPYDSIQTTSRLESFSDRREIALFLHIARYVGVGSRMGFLLEAGPTVRWNSEDFGGIDAYPYSSDIYYHAYDRNSWNYGLDLQAGFEWFFTRRLSLGGRYGISALRTEVDMTERHDFYSPDDGYWDRRFDESHSDGFSIQTTPTALSLTGYW